MNFYSTNNRSLKANFREAVLKGLAPDNGLYQPESIPVLKKGFLQTKNLSLQEIGYEAAKKFTGNEITNEALNKIITESLNFLIPVFPISDHVLVMELFHGPTLAFKDVGARFMARTLSHFIKNKKKEITVLAATSGDTGSAVASGFYGAEGLRVVILYPSGGISRLQEKQMTTMGKNITALEVSGTFDDCQRLVKRAFADADLKKKHSLTSANSINIARLIPQMFYYLYAYSFLREKQNIVFSVPSGNFGNLTAGLMAKKMGMKADFIAATNSNNVVPEFLESGTFTPKPSRKTLSNAMDVGNPSNFSRILDLYNNAHEDIRKEICGYSITDEETKSTIKRIALEKNYLLDPHGAVAYTALEKHMSKQTLSRSEQTTGIFLATAHPAKFWEVVEDAIGRAIILPDTLKACLEKEKSAVKITADYNSLKELLS